MEIGNGIREKQTARIVPVVLGLDHFGAMRGDKFAGVNLQTFANRRKVGEIGFLQILVKT